MARKHKYLADGRLELVTRHVADETGAKRPPLSPEHTQALLNAAIELHDRQVRRSQRWTVLIPIWVALIGGIIVLIKESAR